MEQINKIELLGNVGSVRVQDVGGNQVANFSVVTNFAYKNKEGTAIIETMWHNVVAWNGIGMPDLKKIERGRPVRVLGRLRCRKYTGQDGIEKQVTEVVANRMELLECEDQPQVAQ